MPRVFVPREADDAETRVAATPETVKRMVAAGFEVAIASGAGERASFVDAAYAAQGATLVSNDAPNDSASAGQALAEADVVLSVGLPSEGDCGRLKRGALLISFASPHGPLARLQALNAAGVTVVAMELVPRISRAQSMDALSSQASIAGYKAVLIAAAELDKYFPLLMTAAGTIQPARVVIMGAGVAGLQAIATAKRLGAVVEVSDVRPAVKEQVASLGGRFIEVPLEAGEGGEDAGGYAKEVSADFLKRQQAIVRERVVAADVVITTALVPGRPAPKLITADMVEAMRPGSVIVDLAVVQGGNCELSEPGRSVKHGVIIVAPENVPATVPLDASQLYARNVLALLLHYQKHGLGQPDLNEEIIASATLAAGGEVRHAASAARLAADAGKKVDA